MTLLSHPSDEQLSAFFDRQLPPDELTEIETHLSQCSDCTEVVADLTLLESWGPAVEERLPSDLYWQDLPERVLARIAREDRAPAVARPAEASASWWRRLMTPGSTWAWLGATAAVAVVGGWFYLREDGPRETAAAVEPAVGGEVSTPSEELPPGVPPLIASNDMGEDEYRSRVATTLGMGGDIGEPIDVVPVVNGQGDAAVGTRVIRVNDASPVPPGALEASDLLGTPELNYYFNSARRLEELGRSDLAAHGYRILGEKATANPTARLAAETGLVRCAWRSRIAAAGPESSRTLEAMFNEGDAIYRRHLAGDHSRCRQGWETYMAFLGVAGDCVAPAVVQEAQRRAIDLEPCVQ